jgi:hypothetical protein
MKKVIILLSVLLAVAIGASADQFNFAYSGIGVAAGGVITAAPQGGGEFLVTDITGFYNGDAIAGIVPCGPAGSICNNYGYLWDNLLFASEPHFDYYGLLFSTAGGDIVNVYVDGAQYINWDQSGGTRITSGYVGDTPEPSTLLMLGTGMIGLAGVIRRKLS